ncbi:epoxide hydrolase family protein [Mycobacterium branderi]|uniref:Hydrolase n=1 Tax=Mycobacterium branderi TaxID=43348 RepID=A0A7I7WDC2_9MYCO|nr:epoxide hydrolase family protein [Mycobacterium branderi]MCV7234654.1 epoxide hydrolase [Mycobacterium branderi]ORA33188.1 epoxide hydrolase [Mycobacterium branderi]BBZ15444.1 hydrolase [Mycobacterium branderi]
MGDAIQPFRIRFSDADRADLRDRLRRTRWPEAETVDDWSQGIPLAVVQELCSYWADEYDWQATEDRLNDLGQFRTEIDGLGVHFLHVRSPHPDALPLIITHGWPGSVIEFLKVVGPLTDPPAHGGDAADAFHVVCPSLPGYGFSDKPSRTGWGVERIADAWAVLMARLGYHRYGAQGGDWGSAVTTCLGQRDPEHVAGIHLNLVLAGPDESMLSELTSEEQAMLATISHHQQWGAGYSTQQSTRPQTLGYGLVDSPAAQCAWIAEKFWAWVDCDGDLFSVLSRDELLDNVMFYWVPAAGASSARLYWESLRRVNEDPVTVPVGCSQFPKEVYRASRRWAEKRFPDLRWWNELGKGGHFAAFEQPTLFIDEVRSFFRTVR